MQGYVLAWSERMSSTCKKNSPLYELYQQVGAYRWRRYERLLQSTLHHVFTTDESRATCALACWGTDMHKGISNPEPHGYVHTQETLFTYPDDKRQGVHTWIQSAVISERAPRENSAPLAPRTVQHFTSVFVRRRTRPAADVWVHR